MLADTLLVDWLVGRGMVEVMLMWLQSLSETRSFQRRHERGASRQRLKQQADEAAAIARDVRLLGGHQN